MADYSPEVKKILRENGCHFDRAGRATMKFGSAQSQNASSL